MIVNFEQKLISSFLISRAGIEPVLLRASVEKGVDYEEGDHSTADYGASRDRAPEDICSREMPNREQAGDDRNQNAETRRPETDCPHQTGIQEASSIIASIGLFHLHNFSLGLGGRNRKVCAHRSQFGQGCDPQRHMTRVIANPHSYLHPVGLRIIGCERDQDGGDFLAAQLNGFTPLGSNY